jgi:hypothetical protein
VYESISKSSKVFADAIDSFAYAIDIPAYGYQLYDLINKQATGYLAETELCHIVKYTDPIANDPHSLYAINKARIVVTFKALPQELSNSYQLVMNVRVPVVQFLNVDDKVSVSINSVNGVVPDTVKICDNQAFIYVSKATKDLALTYSFSNFSTAKDESGKLVPYFILEFKANETKDLPILIARRF